MSFYGVNMRYISSVYSDEHIQIVIKTFLVVSFVNICQSE